MQAATLAVHCLGGLRVISIPAAYAGCNVCRMFSGCTSLVFQSPQPMRAATRSGPPPGTTAQFQSPQPMRAATRVPDALLHLRQISIPAAYAGCDIPAWSCPRFPGYFNPRSLCGLRHVMREYATIHGAFQSPQPMRAATLWDEPLTVVCCISIPAAYAGCDAEVEMTARLRPDFNLYSLG